MYEDKVNGFLPDLEFALQLRKVNDSCLDVHFISSCKKFQLVFLSSLFTRIVVEDVLRTFR